MRQVKGDHLWFSNNRICPKCNQMIPYGLLECPVCGMADFIRKKMREKSFLRTIMPPMPISDAELDRMISSDGAPSVLPV